MHPRSRGSFVVFMSCTFTTFAWFRRVNNLHLLLFYLQYPPPVCLVCCIPRGSNNPCNFSIFSIPHLFACFTTHTGSEPHVAACVTFQLSGSHVCKVVIREFLLKISVKIYLSVFRMSGQNCPVGFQDVTSWKDFSIFLGALYIHTCMHTYIHTYIHTHIYIYVYIYIYILINPCDAYYINQDSGLGFNFWGFLGVNIGFWMVQDTYQNGVGSALFVRRVLSNSALVCICVVYSG